MKTNRRQFLETSLAASLSGVLPGFSIQSENVKEKYKKLDEILVKPVLKKELFSAPVIIETLELLKYKNSFLCMVRSKNGAAGISVANNDQMKSLWPVFKNHLQPFFTLSFCNITYVGLVFP